MNLNRVSACVASDTAPSGSRITDLTMVIAICRRFVGCSSDITRG